MRFCVMMIAFEQQKIRQKSGLTDANFRIPETKPKLKIAIYRNKARLLKRQNPETDPV